MTDRATKGITPAPTSRSLTARFMTSTDVTEWNALVAATITMTRTFPTRRRGNKQRRGDSRDTVINGVRTWTQNRIGESNLECGISIIGFAIHCSDVVRTGINDTSY